MTNTNSPSINAEIVSAPAVSHLTVTPIGRNMFSMNLNAVMVVRFPDSGACTQPNQLLVSTRRCLQPVRFQTSQGRGVEAWYGTLSGLPSCKPTRFLNVGRLAARPWCPIPRVSNVST